MYFILQLRNGDVVTTLCQMRWAATLHYAVKQIIKVGVAVSSVSSGNEPPGSH